MAADGAKRTGLAAETLSTKRYPPRMHGGGEWDGSGPITVLLVEDDRGDALLVQELLASEILSFEVTWVCTLAEAVGSIGDGIDCVLLDLGLPDTHGVEALRAVTHREQRPAVVVLTGIDDRVSGAEAVALGAQDYLSKSSVDEQTLARSIRYAIARHRAEDASRQLREADLVQAERARLERGLLPRPLTVNPELTWATRYQSGGRRVLLGGDFFDAVELADGTIRIVVGDVSGHGPEEAALGVALRVGWRAMVLGGQPPEATLDAVERLLEAERSLEETFATVCDIEILPDLRHGVVRTAGHPGPLLFDGTAVVELEVPLRRTPLATTDERAWVANPVDLGPEWTLIVYTDGIVEGYAAGPAGRGRLGIEGLIDIVSGGLAESATLEELADSVLAASERANGSPFRDDVALVLISNSARWRP
jgi:serine phosphatase RsbU (regulator of sigma subunit)